MSFITEWMESKMDGVDQIRASNHRAVKISLKGGAGLKKDWSAPFYPTEPTKRVLYVKAREEELMHTGSDGKQSKYLATATSRANTYDSVLDIYTKIEISKEAAR